LIADFLLSLDYVIKFLTLQFLNFATFIFSWFAEAIIKVGGSNYGFLRQNVTEFQINNQTALSLINYPECVECSDENNIIGGGQTGFTIDYFNGGCSLYDTVYDESLATGYFILKTSNTNTYTGCSSNAAFLPANYHREYVTTLAGLTGYTLLSTAIYGGHRQGVSLSDYKNSYNNGDYPTDIRNFSCERYTYNGGFVTQSARSEFYNGVFYIVPGTQTAFRLTKVINEYYRRKRVGKMFCGGIVNYAFLDNWLSGSLYFTQFKAKRIITAINRNSENLANYCRNIARLVIGQKRLYYRSAPTSNGISFTGDTLNKPTTFVDLGPRDEFIKEICIDPKLDPNCSVSRSIGATSYQDLGELLGLAINYRMDIANTSGNLDMFFQNDGFSSGVGISNVLDGDILQLLSINNESGIEEFDLQNPKYLGYQFNVLDPEQYPQVFKNGNANYGPLPITLELDDDGQRIRSCLNEPGRLTESSQKVPFYLWNKKGTGFEIGNRRYLGAKTRLIGNIQRTIIESLGRIPDSVFDIFAGSGAVGSSFASLGSHVIMNDILLHNSFAHETFLLHQKYSTDLLVEHLKVMSELAPTSGYITESFGGMYFSISNAKVLDSWRDYIETEVDDHAIEAALLTCLMYAADKVAQTVGHYDAFFSGNKIDKAVELRWPIGIGSGNGHEIVNGDANEVIHDFESEVLYLDPPYNSRQYSDNYHVLENIARWEKPEVLGVSRKMDRSGLKSRYSGRQAELAFEELIIQARAELIVLSYSNTGSSRVSRSNNVLTDEHILKVLRLRGEVHVEEIDYKEFSVGKTSKRPHHERLFVCKVRK
jgi:adenine-specific DNA-methyltransferase